MNIAKKQIEDEAHVIDINLDNGMLDDIVVMQNVAKIIITEPEVTKVPFMLHVYKFEIVMAELKWYKGFVL